jgi:hypothetical protein
LHAEPDAEADRDGDVEDRPGRRFLETDVVGAQCRQDQVHRQQGDDESDRYGPSEWADIEQRFLRQIAIITTAGLTSSLQCPHPNGRMPRLSRPP